MNSLNRLLLNTPVWVRVVTTSPHAVDAIVAPPLTGGKPPKSFHLILRLSKQGGVIVSEKPTVRCLPDFCAERHINPDGSFCVFYRSDMVLTDDDAALTWWSHLSSYLNNQLYAQKTGVWPLGAGLSHGDAAHVQVAMEELAEPLGWKDDLWQAMFRGKGWLAGSLPRTTKKFDRVLNARTPCPRGCSWKHRLLRKISCTTKECYADCQRLHKPILRADCPNRKTVEALVLYEHQRRRIENAMMSELQKEGKICCGTMKHCALKKL